MSVNIETLKHNFLFRNGTLNGNSALVNLEIKLTMNEITTMSLKLSHDIGLTYTDNIDISFGYGSSDILPITLPYQVLSMGSTGSSVLLLEQLLNEHGFMISTPASTFNSATQAGVFEFQDSNNLIVDGVVGNQTWIRLFTNSSYSSCMPNRFYADGFRKTNEYFEVQAIEIDFKNTSKSPITYINSTCVSVAGAIASSLGYGLVVPSASTFFVGTAELVADPVVHKGDSRLDALFKLGDYAQVAYLWDKKVFVQPYSRYWSQPNVPLITDGELLTHERDENTFDAVKIIDSIKWRSPSQGQYTPSTITYVDYGSTLDLREEGFYENSTSAFARLQGAALSGNAGTKSLRIKTPGKLGSFWLPGRTISVGNQNGTSSRWVIRSHVMNYGSDGFTSTFDLGALRIT